STSIPAPWCRSSVTPTTPATTRSTIRCRCAERPAHAIISSRAASTAAGSTSTAAAPTSPSRTTPPPPGAPATVGSRSTSPSPRAEREPFLHPRQRRAPRGPRQETFDMASTPAQAGQRWVNRPEGSTWGDFGPDDQLGRLNLVDANKVRQGVAEVREGKTFCLSLPLDLPGGNALNPRRHPPRLRPTQQEGVPRWMFEVGRVESDATDVINDDVAVIHLQYSTQWDSFAHVGSLFDANGDGRPEPVFYNGYRGGVELPREEGSGEAMRSGVKALGVHNFAVHGIQGRGVLIDLRAHFGDERTLVGYD